MRRVSATLLMVILATLLAVPVWAGNGDPNSGPPGSNTGLGPDRSPATGLPLQLEGNGEEPLPCEWQTLFYEDFEAGFGNWSMDGLWNPENETDVCGSYVAPYPSSVWGAYFGIDGICTFNTSYTEVGNLTLGFDVNLSNAVQAEVSYWSYEQTECGGENCGWDHRYVQYSTDGGGSWVTAGTGGPEDVWHNPTFGLPAGAPLRVRFQFDTIDPVLNDFFGWMVDDVEIRGCFPSTEPVFATHVRMIPLPGPGYLLGLVRVATGNGSTPLPGATVETNWTIPPGGYVVPQTRTSNAKGLAFPVMLLNWQGTYTLDLVNITSAGYIYDPNMNWESSASYTLP